jgi:cytochrome c556
MNKILTLCAFSFLLNSCSNNEKEFEMYEVSEMASLMKQMAHINEQLRERILSGEELGEFPSNFENILQAKMTQNQEMDDFFKEHAQQFLDAQHQIYNDPDNAKEHFNIAIDACVKCHEMKCPGPVSRIKKLRI